MARSVIDGQTPLLNIAFTTTFDKTSLCLLISTMFGDYHFKDLFPSPPTAYTHVGRGGAGNVAPSQSKQSDSIDSSQDYPTLPISPELANYAYPPPPGMSTASSERSRRRRQRYYSSGRGGLGNLHPASEMAIFSFDEELEKLNKVQEAIAPVYHIGRGGAGNYYGNGGRSPRDSWNSSDSSSSGSSSTLVESQGGAEWFRRRIEKMRDKFPL